MIENAILKIYARKRYYKGSRRGKSPSTYRVTQPCGVGSSIHGTIYLAPVLKRHKDLRAGVLKHELGEIRAWGGGTTNAHTIGSSKEPKVTKRLGGVKGFWEEIDRRERAK